jgi:acyl-CoA synthetase (AMP-forming)/AMP-acid ligase II
MADTRAAALPWTYRPVTLDAGVRAAFNRTPDKLALREGERTLTYRQLISRINRVSAAAVGDLGLRVGDRAAILATNCLEYIEVMCGISGVGVAVATPSPRLTAAEVKLICDDCGARVLFVEKLLEDMVRAIKFATVERIIVIGSDYDDWLARGRDAAPDIAVDEWQPFSIPYTSGTTGQPKGVTLPHRARTLIFYAMAVEYGCYSPDDRALAVAPLCHGAGFAFAMAPVYFGGYCEIIRRFEPDRILHQLNAAEASNIFLVPTHFHAIFGLEKPLLDRYRRDGLHTIISNAAPLAQATKVRIVDFFGPGLLHETYGSTESGIVCSLRPQDQLRKIKCVGLPFPNTEVRVLDADGNEVGPDTVGELYSRSPYHYNGYWGRPAETRASFRGDWFSAGDMAQRDDEGYIYLVDRKKDLVISGGINVYPREIEEVLFAHPAVAEAAVIGIPDDYWGEVLKAFVVVRRGAAPGAEDLLAHCRTSLAGYKIPKSVEFIDALPRNTAGKVLKNELRASHKA